MKTYKTYEYKLYNSKRNRVLHGKIELACEIYNHSIALTRRYYRLTGKHLSGNRLKKHYTKLKRLPKYAHWKGLGSQAIQDVAERIDRSYQAFFSHVKKKGSGRKSPPHFQKRKSYKSFTLKQAGYRFHDGNRVTIMGREYKYSCSRPLEGEIKTLTVKRNQLNELFLFVVCEQEANEVLPRLGKTIGYDFGLKHFLNDSEGGHIDSPEFYKHNLTELRRKHRNLSKKVRGSNNRKRAKEDLFRFHEKVANQRRAWFYETSIAILSENACVYFEDLNLQGMKKLWGRKVSDLAFAEFLAIMEAQCRKTGSAFVKVGRFEPTSKACHHCGTLNKELTLSDREWTCQGCGETLDRDKNAAINIRNLGIKMTA